MSVVAVFTLFGLAVADATDTIHVSKPKEPSKLQTALDKIQELQGVVSKYVEEVDTLRAEKVKLTKTVRRLKAKNKKLDTAGGGGTSDDVSDGDKQSEIDPQLEIERAEEYFRRETGQLALEMHKLNSERHQLERELEECKKNTEGCEDSHHRHHDHHPQQQQQASCEVITGDLQEKLTNCDETVKAVRQHCADDQEKLRKTTQELASVTKDCGSCTTELKDCKNTRDYLEFLKRGYEVVVPDLENEAKEAKENRQKTEDEAENAFKDAANTRLYLVIFCIVISVFVSVKLYEFLTGIWRQRLQTAAANKAQEKLNKRKRK